MRNSQYTVFGVSSDKQFSSKFGSNFCSRMYHLDCDVKEGVTKERLRSSEQMLESILIIRSELKQLEGMVLQDLRKNGCYSNRVEKSALSQMS